MVFVIIFIFVVVLAALLGVVLLGQAPFDPLPRGGCRGRTELCVHVAVRVGGASCWQQRVDGWLPSGLAACARLLMMITMIMMIM